MLGARNSSQIDEIFTRGKHRNLDVYYNNQSYFGLPRQILRRNSDIKVLYKQTIRDVESIHRATGAYDMKHYDSKEMCCAAWSEKSNYLCIGMVRNKIEVNIVISMKTKTHLQNAFQKPNIFK